MAKQRKKLGELLVDWNVIDPNGLADALAYAKEHGKRIGEALVDMELCDEDDVAKALATQFGLEYIDLDKQPVNRDVLGLIPSKLIEECNILPLGEEGNRLKIIITDPLDLETIDLLRFRVAKEVIPSLAAPSKVRRFIDKFVTNFEIGNVN